MPTKYIESAEEFLRKYDASQYARPNTSVDVVIFTIIDGNLNVLTVKRSEHPFIGHWSLVGGYIDIHNDKDLVSTAKRKLEEKTGIKTPYLEQYKTIGNATRDPRGWSVTTIYFALLPCSNIALKTGQGASDIKWTKINKGKIKDNLAFDHVEILEGCVERLRSKVLYTSLPAHLMPKEFTLGELQKVYEIILDKKIDHKSFRRRILNAALLEDTKKMRHESKKPAILYRLKDSRQTHFFIRTIEGCALEE